MAHGSWYVMAGLLAGLPAWLGWVGWMGWLPGWAGMGWLIRWAGLAGLLAGWRGLGLPPVSPAAPSKIRLEIEES